jgi:hypothetical protein
MRALPAPPPVMGFTGANPSRAVEAMTGGIKRIGASQFQPLTGDPAAGFRPPPRIPASQFNPLSNAGQFANPKTMVTFAPGTPAAPRPVDYMTPPASAPVPGMMPTAPPTTMAGANVTGVSGNIPQLTPNVTYPPLKTAANAQSRGGAAAPPTTRITPTATGTMAGATSPVAAAAGIAGAIKPPAQPTGAIISGTPTRTDSAFSPYSAADPNRALKMMRGF